MRRSACVMIVLLAAGCGGGDSGDSGTEAAHAFCVEETNRYRTDNGRPAVSRSAALEAYADDGAEVDHYATPHDHFSETSGGGIAFAENECPHWSLGITEGDLTLLVEACIEAFFSEGPGGGHYDNMMGNYGTLGCGLYVDGDDVTIIQDFGQ